MQEVQHYPAGTFCWVELATSDAAGAKAFYGELFGWQAHDMPADEHGVYTMLKLHGKDVAGLYELGPEQRAQNVPPHWFSYVAVDDADAATEKVGALGGTVIAPATAVDPAGRMAIVQDPTGAVFGLWQAGEHIGARLVNMPNTWVWNELNCIDTDKAAAFYGGLLGWTSQATPMGDGVVYTSFQNQGRMTGGMASMNPESGEMPAAWSVYFMAADCDATVAKAADLGGTVLQPAFDIANIGRFAVLQDPQGAVLLIGQMEWVDPPPGYEQR